MSLEFSFAVAADSAAIADLVNSAYRGDSSRAGWTTEAHLLDGQRTDAHEIKQKIEDKNSFILIARKNKEWKLKKITMTVITLRTELIEYYIRRGFRVTNDYIPFPTEERFGIPKVKDLQMVYLVKDIHE